MPTTDQYLTTNGYANTIATMTNNNIKYDFISTDTGGNPEIRTLRPRYDDKNDGLERDNQLYLEEENYLFHASIITMTTLLIAAIVISAQR
jgi:hypothetical protein